MFGVFLGMEGGVFIVGVFKYDLVLDVWVFFEGIDLF